MQKNARKALEEHRQQTPPDPAYFETIPAARPIHSNLLRIMDPEIHEERGIGSAMEDTHVFVRLSNGAVLTAVFDGHNGPEVAEYAKTVFAKKFEEALTSYSVHDAFEVVINQIQQELYDTHEKWDDIGCTAVVSYIDPYHRLIYTATLGDSEANIYRKEADQMRSLPLSCVRNWTSSKDEKRAGAIAHYYQWDQKIHAKARRVGSLNVSRALGDVENSAFRDIQRVLRPAVIHKPKITVQQLQPGDCLILCCDGVKDFVSETDLTKLVETSSDGLAQRIARFALVEKRSNDNITVMVIRIE